MNAILAILFIIVFAAFWTWVFWGVLSVIYHTVMASFFALVWVTITVLEFMAFVSKAISRVIFG